MEQQVILFFLIMIAAHIYFLPALIAGKRGLGNYRTIFNINLFLGLTVLGWILALIMALQKEKQF